MTGLRSLTHLSAFTACVVATAGVGASAPVPHSVPPGLLPAYAHNDYFNEHPLFDALRLGYVGVEVDCFLVGKMFLVAHDRRRVRAERSLEAMYLEPLRQRIQSHGSILPGTAIFTVNLELKKGNRDTYAALCALLARYEDILTIVRDGRVEPGPVRIILVGWTPSIEELASESIRYVSIHEHHDALYPNHNAIPSHLLSLVSVEYRGEFIRQGTGPVSRRSSAALSILAKEAHAVPGRMLRVYEAPYDPLIYRALLDAGVDMIGTKDLERGSALLIEALR